MSTFALPVALPPGVTADGAYQEQVPKTTTGASGYSWTVPSGEVWLWDAVYGEFFKAALTANFTAVFTLLDESLSSITGDMAGVTNQPAGNGWSYHARYGAAPVFQPNGLGGPIGSLSHVFAMPGTQWQLTYRPFVGGDSLNGRAVAYVTKMEFGPGSGGAGGPGVVAGPALYVPGPEPAVAA